MITTLFLKKILATDFFAFFIFLLFLLLKIYRIIFFARILLEYLPAYNGYVWPISIVYYTTNPIMKFYKEYLPSFKIGKIKIDPTSMLTLELFSILIEFMSDIKDAYLIPILLS